MLISPVRNNFMKKRFTTKSKLFKSALLIHPPPQLRQNPIQFRQYVNSRHTYISVGPIQRSWSNVEYCLVSVFQRANNEKKINIFSAQEARSWSEDVNNSLHLLPLFFRLLNQSCAATANALTVTDETRAMTYSDNKIVKVPSWKSTCYYRFNWKTISKIKLTIYRAVRLYNGASWNNYSMPLLNRLSMRAWRKFCKLITYIRNPTSKIQSKQVKLSKPVYIFLSDY